MIVALDEIPRASDPCDPSLDWRPVRGHLGIRSFGVNAFLGAQPGDRVVERHQEDGGHEELCVVGAAPDRPFEVSEWETRELKASGLA